MIIIGVDFHPEFQQIASVDTDSGEFQEKRLAHREDAETFYRTLAAQKVPVGMVASGYTRWFERLVADCESLTKRPRGGKAEPHFSRFMLETLSLGPHRPMLRFGLRQILPE